MGIAGAAGSDPAADPWADRIGFARLTRMAFGGADLRPLRDEIVSKIANGTAAAGEGLAMTFRVGDDVSWTSQAQGFTRRKVGTVAEVVPAGQRPDRARFARLYKGAGVGFARDNESYVVMVGNAPYWPRVAHLKAARD